MRHLKFPFFIVLIFLTLPTFAQQLDHVQGELLVKLRSGATPRNLVQNQQQFRNTATQLKVDRKVSEPMNIYSLTFDWTNINENDLLTEVWRNPDVEVAQFNHLLQLRATTPNDPRFNQQWQYINTGQSGGMAGADIDTDLAWDLSTGGLTPDGDTIVVCIIDGGFEIDHEDLADNVWYNHAEIPGNGIDDDNNGFVDDFRGWNTGSGRDNVDQGDAVWHGTAVAGIVGAKGNNGIGVAGVNWDVKMMLVSGGTGVESEVLEAYSFPLAHRKRYNETNGAEGAFVVATNASWGLDGGQASEAPLWCAFYDSLGVHGILNAGATINGNQNVDTFGDLPTTCPSDYLISVTNLDHNDQKVIQAGYGVVHIDLGAFGEGTFTAAAGNAYGGFGGTSGATPHVAGAIGLLYSAPCSDLTSLAKDDPAAAALLVKDYLLNGVDQNASLAGITLTEGRLNVNNSMLLLMANCGPCPRPGRLAALDLTDTAANLTWNSNDNAITDTLRWRQAGATDWNIVENAMTPYGLSALTPCTKYEFQVVSSCDTTTSDYSNLFSFKTDGCCEAPSDLAISNISNTEASASWGSILAAQSYNVRIRPVDTNDWMEVNTTDLTTDFSGLSDCTTYEVQIQTICASETTDYSSSVLFDTRGCGACLDMTYCSTIDLDAEAEWIESVVMNTLNNTSGADGGYADFGNTFMNELAVNNTYDITLTPGFNYYPYEEFFKVWIDYNQDGDFEDMGEEVYQSPGTTAPVTGSITIPDDAMMGLTKMRIVMIFENAPLACDNGQTGWFGETEDYCVNIVGGAAPCNIPNNLNSMDLTEETATLSWESTTAAEYQLRYKMNTQTDWTMLTTSDNTMRLENLTSCTEYEAQVKSVCTNGESEFSDSHDFTTICVSSASDLAEEISDLQVFPNPFAEQLSTSFTLSGAQPALRVDLVNQLGQVLQSEVLLTGSNGQQQVVFEGRDLTAGIYFVKIQTADGKYIARRVVKMK